MKRYLLLLLLASPAQAQTLADVMAEVKALRADVAKLDARVTTLEAVPQQGLPRVTDSSMDPFASNNHCAPNTAPSPRSAPTLSGEKGTVPFFSSDAAARAESIRTGQPYVLWINYKCPSSANQLPGYAHSFAPSWMGDGTQRVAVGVPMNGQLYWSGEPILAANCCAASIDSMVSETRMRMTPRRTVMRTSTAGWGGMGMQMGMSSGVRAGAS
jgi:hypothetical protein